MMTVADFNDLYDAFINNPASNDERFYSAVVAHTYSRLGDEDLAQEVAVKVFENLSKYKHEGKFLHWLNVIITNVEMDSLRAKKMDRSICWEFTESAELISLCGLSDEVLKLANLFLEGYTVSEIATKLEISPSAARKRLQRMSKK